MRPAQIKQALSQHRGVAFLCLSVFATMLGQGAISPVLPLFTDQEFHVSRTQVGLAVGFFGVGRMVTSVPAGYLAQRHGRRFVLILGTAGNLLGSIMVAFSFSYGWLLGWRIISGLGASMFTTGVSVYLRDVSTPQSRGRFLSLQELSILVGVTIGPIMGGVMGDTLGLRSPLYLQAGVILGALALVMAFVPETREQVEQGATAGEGGTASASRGQEAAAPGAYRKLLLSAGFILVGLFSLMIVANRQGGRFTIMPLFGEDKGFGPDALGAFISITHLPQFFSVLAAGYLTDRFGRKSTIIPAAGLMVLGIMVFIRATTFPELMLSGILLGVGEGLAGPPTAAFFADIAPRGLEGVTMGLFRTFGGAGSLVGALLLGTIADFYGFGWSLGIDAILLGASALGVTLFVRETVRKRRLQAEETA